MKGTVPLRETVPGFQPYHKIEHLSTANIGGFLFYIFGVDYV